MKEKLDREEQKHNYQNKKKKNKKRAKSSSGSKMDTEKSSSDSKKKKTIEDDNDNIQQYCKELTLSRLAKINTQDPISMLTQICENLLHSRIEISTVKSGQDFITTIHIPVLNKEISDKDPNK